MRFGRARLRDSDVITNVAVVDDHVRLFGDDSVAALLDACRHPDSIPAHPRCFVNQVRFQAPIARPPAVRDFMAFEQHIANARKNVGLDMDPGWYDEPVFYFSNPSSIYGPDDEVPGPSRSKRLDYELEVACIIGIEARDLHPDDPSTLSVIAGFTFMNDWSARDLQAKEMRQSLGPAKGKDFATSLGPWIVTPDGFEDFHSGRPASVVTASVNGRVYSQANIADIYFSWPQLLAQASRDTTLMPGDVIGSGTVGSGCILELRAVHGADHYPWLADGDVVTFESPELGTLTNTVRAG